MNQLCQEHVSEELLERYLLHRASEGETELVETHLLICDSCQEQLTELEDYRAAMREGFALLLLEERQVQEAVAGEVPNRLRERSWASGLLNWRLPKWSMVSAAAVLALACILVIPTARRMASPAELSLSAERGNEIAAIALSSGRSLQLHLGAGLLPAGEVSVEVVDANGNRISEEQSVVRSGEVEARVSSLAKGTYYVRLYASQGGHMNPDQLLREFVFQVK